MPNIESNLRERIAKFLPRAMEIALGSYRHVTIMEKGDAGDLKKQHEACKVAIAHLELLLKLARWADVGGEQGAVQDDALGDLIRAAQGELAEYEKST